MRRTEWRPPPSSCRLLCEAGVQDCLPRCFEYLDEGSVLTLLSCCRDWRRVCTLDYHRDEVESRMCNSSRAVLQLASEESWQSCLARRRAVHAAAMGDVPFLDQLLSRGLRHMLVQQPTSEDMYIAAAAAGQVKVLDWLLLVAQCPLYSLAKCSRGHHPTATGAAMATAPVGRGCMACAAASGGHADVLGWVLSARMPLCYTAMERAAYEGHAAFLLAAFQLGNWRPSPGIYRAARRGGHIGVLAWLRSDEGGMRLYEARCCTCMTTLVDVGDASRKQVTGSFWAIAA